MTCPQGIRWRGPGRQSHPNPACCRSLQADPTIAMPKTLHLLDLLRRLPAGGRRALLCLLMASLGGQGLSQAIERVVAPSHRHLPRIAPAIEVLSQSTLDVAPRPMARDDHRSIPWIGGEPEGSDLALSGEAHAHGGVASHRHALGDAGVIYVDADEEGSGPMAKPLAAAACPLPATAPRVACAIADGHAAWLDAPLWHALALTSEPLDRPPR